MKKLTIAGLCLSLIGLPASAQELWRGASAGMSVDDVAALFPGTERIDGGTTQLGDYRAALSGLTIERHPWDAKFAFNDQGLSMVALTPAAAVDPVIYTVLFDPISDDLRERYGEPFSCERGQFGRSCEWRWPDRAIRLGYLDVGGSYNLSITYYVRDADRPPL